MSALVLGVIAMLFASSAIGLLIGIAAISAGVVAHRQARRLAVAATTLGVLAASGAAFSLISSGFAAADRNSELQRADASAQRADAELAESAAQIGETVTSDAGVEFTVMAVECGASTAGDGLREKTARGQFCAVDVRLANQGSKPVSVWVNDITGRIGPNTYEAEWSASDLGGELWNADLNPGLATEASSTSMCRSAPSSTPSFWTPDSSTTRLKSRRTEAAHQVSQGMELAVAGSRFERAGPTARLRPTPTRCTQLARYGRSPCVCGIW
ncbi:DUF4352 domain-containing protein [Agromyces tropicus]|uniref:DUF4352 domain-containing protein n=1 Tax=Agromyces tropicus TaxID=555371 RepID=UPI0031E13921